MVDLNSNNNSNYNIDLIIATAKEDNIDLTPNHFMVIDLLKNFQEEFNISPSTRALINYAKNKNPKLQLDSLLFVKLFPNGIAQACHIAGLPKSPRCL